jgi:hypothetical protein
MTIDCKSPRKILIDNLKSHKVEPSTYRWKNGTGTLKSTAKIIQACHDFNLLPAKPHARDRASTPYSAGRKPPAPNRASTPHSIGRKSPVPNRASMPHSLTKPDRREPNHPPDMLIGLDLGFSDDSCVFRTGSPKKRSNLDAVDFINSGKVFGCGDSLYVATKNKNTWRWKKSIAETEREINEVARKRKLIVQDRK